MEKWRTIKIPQEVISLLELADGDDNENDDDDNEDDDDDNEDDDDDDDKENTLKNET